ncbi:hypothetical protein Tco_1573718, partial [Tanacetum coccineum]
MAALESCPKHNMIAYLEKTEGNVEFHEVINFLQRSYISHALTVSDQAKEIKLLKAKITKLKRKANPVIKHFKAYQRKRSTDDQVDASEDKGEGSEERVESTTEQRVSTEEQSKEEIASQASQTSSLTPTSV